MQRVNGRLVLSPTDLTKHLTCEHLTNLDLAAANGEGPEPARPDDALALVFRKGLEHEDRYLARLRGEGKSVVEIETVFDDWSRRKAEAYRMHPAITAAVSSMSYDGRLGSAPDLERQRVDGTGRLTGSGLRFVPVEHSGNEAASTEEAIEVGRLYRELLHSRWTDAEGTVRRLTADDVLIVAPHNAQVGRLRAALPAGARIGTVDKFQGQEAPVVLYSMASSSSSDAPRGVDFLYDLHRFNMALSRGKAPVAVVASPALLDAPVRTPDQLRAVNALCRFTEAAERVEPARAHRPVPLAGGAPSRVAPPFRHGTASMPDPTSPHRRGTSPAHHRSAGRSAAL